MQNEILKRIDLLAEKLGTTSEFIMETIANGIFITSITRFICCILIFIVSTLFAKHAISQLINNKNKLNEGAKTMFSTMSIVTGTVSCITGLIAMKALIEMSAPQYYALHEIFNIFNGR